MSENIYFDVYILKLLKILREMSVCASACECVQVRAISIPTGFPWLLVISCEKW